MAVNSVSMSPAVRAALQRAAGSTGMDFQVLAETARRESGYNAGAKAPTSSATGMFQFIESTWLDMVRRYGAEHGLGAAAQQISLINGRASVADPAARKAILDLRYDPEISARMAGELAHENATALQTRLGRAPTPGEIYAAHVLGPAGAGRLIEAAQQGAPDASTLFPREAAANAWLFKENGVPRSAQALLARLDIAADAVTAPSPATGKGRIDVANADGPTVAAFFDAMFQALAHDLLAPDNNADPLRAAAAYARVQSD